MMYVRPLLATLCLAAAVVAAPGDGAALPPESDAPAGSGFEPALVARLQGLSPDQPIDYFVLAEDVAASLDNSEGRRLARGLFALAYELDARSATPIGLGPSVCLALAQLAGSSGEAQWLLEVGRALDRSSAPLMAPGFSGISDGADPGARFMLAQAIGAGRDDQGKSARTIISRPEVWPLVPTTLAALGSAGIVLEAADSRPHCPGCAGRRFNRAPGDSSGALQPCPVCLGNPGRRLSSEQLLLSLAAESKLLSAEHHFWGAQLLADGGGPLREPDPAELARAYGVDYRRPFWRQATGQSSGWTWERSPRASGAPE